MYLGTFGFLLFAMSVPQYGDGQTGVEEITNKATSPSVPGPSSFVQNPAETPPSVFTASPDQVGKTKGQNQTFLPVSVPPSQNSYGTPVDQNVSSPGFETPNQLSGPARLEVDVPSCINDTLQDHSDFSSALTALQETQVLLDIIENATLILPDNIAFGKFSNEQGIDFGDFFLFESNKEALAQILKLHVLEGKLNFGEISNSAQKQVKSMFLEETVDIRNGELSVNRRTANALEKLDEQRCSVSMVGIDNVLLPNLG